MSIMVSTHKDCSVSKYTRKLLLGQIALITAPQMLCSVYPTATAFFIWKLRLSKVILSFSPPITPVIFKVGSLSSLLPSPTPALSCDFDPWPPPPKPALSLLTTVEETFLPPNLLVSTAEETLPPSPDVLLAVRAVPSAVTKGFVSTLADFVGSPPILGLTSSPPFCCN